MRNLEPGDHACAIDEAGEERARLLSLFVAFGLERQEFCSLGIWPATARRVVKLLHERGIDARGVIRRGALRFVNPEAFYFVGGRFDAGRILRAMAVDVGEALSRGYRCARYAGECERAARTVGRAFAAYERAVGKIFDDYPVIGLCCYSPSTVSADLLAEIVSAHALLYAGASLCRNPFYVPEGRGGHAPGELYVQAARAMSLVSSQARAASAACQVATDAVGRGRLVGREFLLQRFLHAACDLTGGMWGSVHLFDSRRGALRMCACVGGDGGESLSAARRVADSFLERVFRQGEGEILGDSPDKRPCPTRGFGTAAGSVVAAPIGVSGLTTGVLLVGSDTAGSFTERDLELLDAMARWLGVLVPDCAGPAEGGSENGFGHLLAKVSEALNAASPEEKMFGLVCRECCDWLGIDCAALWYLVEGGKILWCGAAEGVGASLWRGCVVEAADRDSPVAAAVRTGTIQVAGGETAAPKLGRVAHLVAGCGSVMAVPVRIRGPGKGCLTLSRLSAGAKFSAPDVERGWQFGAVVSAALGVAAGHAERALAERMEALGHLVNNLSFRLSDPLTGILGFTQLLKMEEKDAVRASYLELVEGEARGLAATLRRVEEFGVMGREKTGRPFEVNAVVAEALATARARWKNEEGTGRPRFLTRVEYGVAGSVVGDSASIRQALVDIIDNAREEMRGVGELGVATWAENGFACVSVADTGVGVSEEIRKRLFDPFFTTKGEDHPGLGLSAAYSVVRRHGGDITVRTLPQKGTVFTVRLPCTGGA